MERAVRYTQWLLARVCVGVGVVAVVVGCHTAHHEKKCKDGVHCKNPHCPNLHIDNCSDIEQGAIPQPVGTYAAAHLNQQSAKAEADDFVIYYNEWLLSQPELGPFGQAHLAQIIERLPGVPFLVIVQPEPEQPVLTMLRREKVVNTLLAAGITDAPKRVVLGNGVGEGLYGEEAERIYPRLILGGFRGGFNFGGGIGNFGGFGALGGFGGFGGFGGRGFGGFGGGGFAGGF